MTSLLADIVPFEGDIVPGEIDPRFRAGGVVNLEGRPIQKVQQPAGPPIQPKSGLGENHLIKQLVNVLQKGQTTSKMTEALPQYRSN